MNGRDQRRQLGLVLQLGDVIDDRLQRAEARLIDSSLIHARPIVVARLLLHRTSAGSGLRGLLQRIAKGGEIPDRQ